MSQSIRWTRWALMTWIVFALLAAVTVAMASASGTGAWLQKVDASVLDAAEGGRAEFVVYLDRQADLSGAASLTSKEAKGRYVYERLTAVADQTQPAVVAALREQGARSSGSGSRTRSSPRATWTRCRPPPGAPRSTMSTRSARAGSSRRCRSNPPGGTNGGDAVRRRSSTASPRSGPTRRGRSATAARAPSSAGADTGVRWTHEALQSKYRGWNGTTANHDYNWHDAIHNPDPANICGASSPTPCDDDELLGGGHGTHTVGTMVGTGPERAGQKNEIGMAPDAKWIACRNMNHGVGVVPTYLECMQWFIAPTNGDGTEPRPVEGAGRRQQLVGLRRGLPAARCCGRATGEPRGRDLLRGLGRERRRRGPVPYVCSTIYHPLARYPEAFTVGRDDVDDGHDRGVLEPRPGAPRRPAGPRAPDEAEHHGAGRRPSARRLRANDSTYGSLSGTSMAGPHVAGLVALIISANPALAGNVDQIEDIIEQTAVRKTTTEMCGLDSPTQVPNNTYGWGRIDALAAVQQAVAERPDLQVTSIDVVNNRPREHRATITATVANTGAMAAGASKTEFLIDGTRVLALVDTGPLASGAARNVSVVWDTKHVAHGPHQITVTADRNGQVAERSETNNSSTVTRTVQGNHVRNGSFESGSGSPDDWSGSSTGAGSSSWSEGGSDGAKSASATGNGGNAAVLGLADMDELADPGHARNADGSGGVGPRDRHFVTGLGGPRLPRPARGGDR